MARCTIRRTKKDANHNEIKKAFENLGFSTKDISQIPNFADLLVARNNRTYLIEIKDGSKQKSRRKLTQGEQLFHNYWRDEVVIIESLEDVLTFTNKIFRGKS